MSVAKTNVEAGQYGEVMSVIRDRIDVIRLLRSTVGAQFMRAETAAFHGRKVVEGIAFGCLLAIDNGLNFVPRDAKGQWNAEQIFSVLRKRNLDVLPSPSIIRSSTEEEHRENSTAATIEGQPDRRLTYDKLTAIYRRLHRWNHELNPYTHEGRDTFLERNEEVLWEDLTKVERFIEKHVITIKNRGFFCVLRDDVDRTVRVVPIGRENASDRS